MKTLGRIVAGGAFVFILNGCGSLEVRVAVLNPTTVEAELDRQLIVHALPVVVGETEADARAQVIEYQQEHFNFTSKLADHY
ncbi:MAG TPA: hypothetical protein VEG34_00095, partial [Thermoanaerobaculia bacterium]|nr:hypothetical protein [Thermoanaerobaculia bacterium]